MRMLATANGSLIAAHGLTLVDVMLLDLLAHSDRSAVRRSALADALMLRPGRVGKRIRSLEKRELVSRRPTPYDRRGVLVSMVPAVMAVTAGQAVLAGPAVTVVPVVLAAVGVPPARAERLSCRLTICGCQGSLAIPARSAPPVLTGEPGPLVPLGRLADTATQLKTPRTCRCGGSSI
jgi:hypothetical protein